MQKGMIKSIRSKSKMRSHSVAMQDHRGMCNHERPHQGKKECARRIKQRHMANRHLLQVEPVRFQYPSE